MTACCCSVSTRKYCVFGCGTCTVLGALIAGLLWPTIYLGVLYSELELRNGSLVFANWIETPLPMYMEFNMFNWTNADQYANHSVKPHFAECGPYVFREHHKRVAVDWHPRNGTVSFNQIRTWHFVPELSVGTLDDRVTSLNVVALSAAYAARNFNTILKLGLNIILNGRATVIGTHSVRELLFDGYKDPLLDFIIDAKVPGINLPPFDRFGWFYDRNNSATYDGRINMRSGAKPTAQSTDADATPDGPASIETVGNVYSWNGSNRTAFYRGDCGRIRGSTGELWHPNVRLGQPVEIFATDVCRTLPLEWAGETQVLGVPGGRWVLGAEAIDNGQQFPAQACYCTGAEAQCPDLMAGVFNVSDCRYGAPAFVSYPHFYMADGSYAAAVEGMRPNRSAHEFGLELEPMTGIPLKVEARLQINMLLQPVERIKLYENVPKLMVPMFWFTQRAALTDEFAAQAKMAIAAPTLGIYTAYGFATLGIIVLLIGAVLTLTKSWGAAAMQHTEFRNEDADDDELRR